MLRNMRIFESFNYIKTLVDATKNASLNDEYLKITDSYKYLLEFLTRGYNDPNKQQQVGIIIDQLYTLTDKSAINLFSKCSAKLFYIRYNNRHDNISELFERFLSITESIPSETDDATEFITLLGEREKVEKGIFNYIWTSFPSTENDIEVFSHILKGKSYHLRSIAIGAILLSLLYFYDERKIILLLDSYEEFTNQSNAKLQETALCSLVCFVIAIFRHNQRSATSQYVAKRIKLLSDNSLFIRDLSSIFLNLVQEKNVETLTKSIQDSLLPGIMKIAPDLIEQAKKHDGVIDITSLEENPEWKNIFDKSGLSKKIEEFSDMQTKGNDVFLNTFAPLKRYPFFKELYNWFRPYHTDNSALYIAFNKMNGSVKSLLNGATYLCDNDKYSFALSLSELPEKQRETMLRQFDMQSNPISEQQEDFISNKQRERFVNNYIKDLYRFFSFFSRRNEFANIFQSNLNLFNIKLLPRNLKSTKLISAIADTDFQAKDYSTAIEYFEMLFTGGCEVEPIYQQKLGFAYQNVGNNDMALKHYLNYFLADEKDVWNIKHIAACYRANKQPDKAAEYLYKASELQPNNKSLLMSLGYCHIEMGQPNKAISEFYKVEYLDEDNHSVWRPLAWCLFLLQDYEKSRKYYLKIFTNDTPNESDYLNFGHLCLVAGKFDEAISYYYNAYSAMNNNIETFATKWRKDIPNLQLAGLYQDDTTLLLDAIMLKITTS